MSRIVYRIESQDPSTLEWEYEGFRLTESKAIALFRRLYMRHPYLYFRVRESGTDRIICTFQPF